MPNPSDHPNASAAIIVGYLASVIVYSSKRAGVELTVEEATTAATALIALVLYFGNRGSRGKK